MIFGKGRGMTFCRLFWMKTITRKSWWHECHVWWESLEEVEWGLCKLRPNLIGKENLSILWRLHPFHLARRIPLTDYQLYTGLVSFLFSIYITFYTADYNEFRRRLQILPVVWSACQARIDDPVAILPFCGRMNSLVVLSYSISFLIGNSKQHPWRYHLSTPLKSWKSETL